jgi:peptidoglycan biosynthesis protein MviN/MurJ (putative lipid II flippase)
VFGAALLVNWIACEVFVPRLGVMGVALASSVGVLAAGVGLWAYAHRRLPHVEAQPIALLIGRTLAAAAVALVVLASLQARIPPPTSVVGRLLLLLGDALSAGTVFGGILFLLGHRWHRLSASEDRGAVV